MRHLLRLVLGRDPARYHVVGEAEDGAEAVERARELKPDLVLLDLRMPVMDGFEALPLLRQALPRAHIVVVSGQDASRFEAQVRLLGADAFIEKGIDPQPFQAALLALHALPPKLEA